MLAVILAVGIDPARSILFHQDHVRMTSLSSIASLKFPQNRHHAELCWILNCLTPIGKLRRMTTWKVGDGLD